MSHITNKKVWERVTSPEFEEMSPPAAKAILRMKLSKEDVARVKRLSSRASEGELSAVEQRELELYLQIGNVITLMHSKARLALKRIGPPARRKSA
jgi:hypothetical protein